MRKVHISQLMFRLKILWFFFHITPEMWNRREQLKEHDVARKFKIRVNTIQLQQNVR